ncbi:MAG: hypothetical protein GMKNLPBB_02088 [Myxococcota bacterium]|nr:hypothetical protein [Myxococcota bacterium]
MTVTCPHCGKLYKLDPSRFTKPELRFRCKACGGAIAIRVSAPPSGNPGGEVVTRAARKPINPNDMAIPGQYGEPTGVRDRPISSDMPKTSPGMQSPRNNSSSPVKKPAESIGDSKVRYRLVPLNRGANPNDIVLSGNRRLSIGRSPENDIIIDYKGLSRQHAYAWPRNDVLLVVDLESRNGIFLNYKRVERAEVRHGDRLSFADVTYQVSREMT